MLRTVVARCRQAKQSMWYEHPCTPAGIPAANRAFFDWHRRTFSAKAKMEADIDTGGSREPMLELSKRRQFKQIPIDQKVLRHLDSLGLGMEKKKVERQRKIKLYERGVLSSAVPGAKGKPARGNKPSAFDHPTWAVKKLASAETPEQIPPPEERLPEVALVGRSNVGKSTLLNALVGLENLYHRRAAVSEKPGTTRMLDFYRMGKGKRAKFVIADMPGYGFAYADDSRRDGWNELMMAYLRGRGTPLKRVMLLLDARHGFKKKDVEFLERLYDPKGPSPLGKYKPPKIQILLTKCDLVARLDLARKVTVVRQQLDEVSRRQTNLSTMMLSALRGQGLTELQRELSSLDPEPTDQDKKKDVGASGTSPNSSPDNIHKTVPSRPALSRESRIVL